MRLCPKQFAELQAGKKRTAEHVRAEIRAGIPQGSKFMVRVEIGASRKIYCNTCKVETNHELKAIHSRRHVELELEDTPFEQLVFWETWDYLLWVCRGCDTATLEESYSNIGMYDPDVDDYGTKSKIFPKRAHHDWAQKRFKRLDPKLQATYGEVIASFNAGTNLLCAIGLRALLEGICVDKGITDEMLWGLEAKLKRLGGTNHLPSNITESLLSFKFIGDTAAHRLESPSRDELKLAIEVMEDLLNFLYEVEYQLVYKAQNLAKMRAADMEEYKKRKEKKQGQ